MPDRIATVWHFSLTLIQYEQKTPEHITTAWWNKIQMNIYNNKILHRCALNIVNMNNMNK